MDYACWDEKAVVHVAAAAVVPPTVIAHLGLAIGQTNGSLAPCTFETLSSESSLQRQRSQDAQEAGGHGLAFVLPQLMATELILGFVSQCDLQVLFGTPCSISCCLQSLHPFLSPLSGLSPEAEDILRENDLKARVTTIQVVCLHSQTHIYIVAQEGIFV